MFPVELHQASNGHVLDVEAKRLLRLLPDAITMRLGVEALDLEPAEPVKPVLYISGPMTGYPELNYSEFRKTAKALRDLGWTVVDPSEHFEGRKDLPRHKYLAADVMSLINGCQGIVQLDKWFDSDGALLEAQLGLDLGYEFFWWSGPTLGLMNVDREEVELILG